ncbi:MAG: FAD-dependent oxidoreductase [Oscillospiraceae bacterium]|jgi:NADPH-dependent 2,4-dienoyl-CoA reductase/sulfur reductase-like enzyme/rhodanese-related sulfurtransferase|nr:FAD-dependent oxidoreductase [Oscillospiraceae bacterium]
MKVVIIGGVAGGATAAARLRRLDETAQIVIFERSGYISYANCGLPYYIGGAITNAQALTLQTPESFRARFRIDARVRHEVMRINREEKTLTVRNLDSGQLFDERYDKLLLSPGAMPVVPNLPGVENVFTLRTVEDALHIRNAALRGVRSAVVVGGGFIGVEMAENLHAMGISVQLVEKMEQVLGQLDRDMASFVHAHMRAKGICLRLGCGVAGFEAAEHGVTTLLEGGEKINADMVVLAIGVAPDSRLAKEAGLALGIKNSIAVSDTMQTSDPNIYAVGDAVSIRNLVTNEPATISLAGPANKQARVAADNIAGLESRYKGAVAASVLKVFDMTVAAVGISERAASAAGIAQETVILSPAAHASYYPGGRVMTMKLLFEATTQRILGAQIVGFEGVDKRIDVLATAMQAGMQVSALKDLDLAYAPPYSSAKDPVNMAGFIAENVITGKVKHFSCADIAALRQDSGAILLDTRTAGEYRRGHAAGFDTHIPVDELRERLHELDKSKRIYVMCQSGLRSYIACRILTQAGFTCYNFAGGYRFYESVENDRFDEHCRTDCGI